MSRFDTWRVWTDQSYFRVVIQELEGETPGTRAAAAVNETPPDPETSQDSGAAPEEPVEA